MSELHLPWLEIAILLPLLGTALVGRERNPDRARRLCLVCSGATLLFTLGAWWDFAALHTFEAHDRWDLVEWLIHVDLFVIDELAAPLLPLIALLHFLTALATLRTKARRFSFGGMLVSESILLATVTCREPWPLVALLAVGTLPPYLELRSRGRSTRVFAVHMTAFIGLLVVGQMIAGLADDATHPPVVATLLISVAVLLRSGVVPAHCWMTDLFENATFGTSLLFVTPMIGAYGAMRLVLPIAPSWVLSTIAVASLVTAVYAAGMALVQREARRFFCYLFLSHSSLVLVGLEIATPVGLTGALCVWLSVGLALGGFGLTLRAVESRTGPLSLDVYHGLYENVPTLAAFFLLTGLASIGFPGTIGFIGVELLVEGAVRVSPWVGIVVVLTGMLNGLAVLWAYFRIFTGTRHTTSIDLRSRPAERVAVLILTLLILGGGIVPQPGVASRYHAANELAAARHRLFPENTPVPHESEPSHDGPARSAPASR